MLKCLREAHQILIITSKIFVTYLNNEQLLTGFYYLYLLPWLQLFPRENFLFIRTEDMKKDTGKILQEIFQFLGMSPLPDAKINKILLLKLFVHEQTMLHDNDSRICHCHLLLRNN